MQSTIWCRKGSSSSEAKNIGASIMQTDTRSRNTRETICNFSRQNSRELCYCSEQNCVVPVLLHLLQRRWVSSPASSNLALHNERFCLERVVILLVLSHKKRRYLANGKRHDEVYTHRLYPSHCRTGKCPRNHHQMYTKREFWREKSLPLFELSAKPSLCSLMHEYHYKYMRGRTVPRHLKWHLFSWILYVIQCFSSKESIFARLINIQCFCS